VFPAQINAQNQERTLTSPAIQNQINLIPELLSSEPMRNFYDNVRLTDPGDYPFETYLGINFTRDKIINCKAYAGYWRRLRSPEIARFLTQRRGFNSHYHEWTPSRRRNLELTGCTFALKMQPEKPPMEYFHYRVPLQHMHSEKISPDGELKPENSSLNYGFSQEFRLKEEGLSKHYFYFMRDRERRIISERFKDPGIFDAPFLEYTQTEKYEKVIMWFISDIQKGYQYLKSLNWPMVDAIVDWMAQFGCVPVFPGVYHNGDIRSILFFRFPVLSNAPMDDERNKQIHTLESFSCFFR
tara:strand:+ start:961 stop:1854 length:894 start_codon:yes stop_codon:yes gene_type:complete